MSCISEITAYPLPTAQQLSLTWRAGAAGVEVLGARLAQRATGFPRPLPESPCRARPTPRAWLAPVGASVGADAHRPAGQTAEEQRACSGDFGVACAYSPAD